MQRSIMLLLSIAVAVGGCADPDERDQSADEIADRVVAHANEVAPPAAGSLEDSGCTRVVVTDEYGFETTTLRCATDLPEITDLDPDAALNLDAVVEADGLLPLFVLEALAAAVPPELGEEMGDLVDDVAELEGRCGVDLEEWLDAMERVVARLDRMVTAVERSEQIEPGSTELRAVGRAVFERVVVQPGCARVAAPLGSDDSRLDRVLTVTSRTAEAAGEFDRVLSGSSMSRLFHFFSTKPNYEWMRSPIAPPEIVVIGTSQAGAAIEVDRLTSATGRQVGNAFLPGSLAEVQQHWVDEVVRYTAPSIVLWPMGPVDLLGDCVDTERVDQFLARRATRRLAFASSGWFTTIDPIDVVLGRVHEPNGNMGDAVSGDAPIVADIDAQSAGYGATPPRSEACPDRLVIIGEVIERLRGFDVEVVVVEMPVSPLATTLIGRDDDTIAAAAAALEGVVIASDGVYVPLPGVLDDEAVWRDLTHPTVDGAARYTDAVATAIERLGGGG